MTARILSVFALALFVSPGFTAAQVLELEAGARYEELRLDGDFEFSCTCDPEEDPGCDTDPDFCREGRLEEPHDGFLVGGFVGAHGRGEIFSLGFRLGATFGSFDPVGAGPNAQSAELFHITGEVPIEAHLALPGTEIFVQIAPRFGFLNLGQQDGGFESPDTATFGALLMAGVRFGGSVKVGAAAGVVQHPFISGWAVEASVRTALPKGMKSPVNRTPLGDLTAPVEPVEPATPVEPAAPAEPAAPTTPDLDAPKAPAPPPS